MNARKTFLLQASKKTLYLTTLALVAVSALGLFLLSKNGVSAQQETRSGSKTATPGMLTLALNFGSAAEYTVFADKGVVENEARIGGKVGIGQSDARAREDLTKAFAVMENLPCTEKNEEIRAGKYSAGVFCARTGDLKGSFVLDGEGNQNAIFIFRSEGKLSAGRDLNVTLTGGAQAHNVFFVSSATVEVDGINLNGNVMARGAIKVSNGATVGRAMSVEGKVDVKNATVEGATGVLQICKTAFNPTTNGMGSTEGTNPNSLDNRVFRFQIGSQIILVPVGSCSGPITLPAGNVVIDELIDGPVIPTGSFSGRFRLLAVLTDPADALVDVNLPIRRATVFVRPGTIQNQTVVEFINVFAINAIIEICKFPARDIEADGTGIIPRSDSAAAQGDPNIRDRDIAIGTPFEFTVDALPGVVITVPVGGCSPAIQVNVPTNPAPAPAVGQVFVTELGQTEPSVGIGGPINAGLRKCTYRLDGAPETLAASTFPADRLNSIDFNVGVDSSDFPFLDAFSNPCGGVVGADVLEGGIANQTTINFWNRSEPGYVKICKVAGFGVPIGTRFAFDVFGRESSNSPRVGTGGPPPTLNPGLAEGFLPGGAGNILPGFDTVRRVVVPAGPAPNGFCEFVSFLDITNLLVRAQYITGSQVLVVEVGANSVVGLPAVTTPNLGPPPVLPNNDPRAAPVDPIPLNNVPFSIPAGSVGGVACTAPNMPTNPCPQVQTNPPTGVRVGNIRLNAGVGPQFVSPSTINNLFILPNTVCTTALGNATNNGLGSVTLNPNPNVNCRAAIFRARRGTVEVEFTDFLFRPVLLKVCKTGGAGLDPSITSVNFTVVANGAGFPPATTTTVAVPVGGCAFAQGPFTATATDPPVGTFAFGQTVVITEAQTTPASTVTAFNVLAGTEVSEDLPNRRGTVGLTATTVAGGIAVNEVEFVNGGPPAPRSSVAFDFDGDGKSDFSAFRPSNGTWHILRSRDGYAGMAFGIGTDTLAAADYDGDGKTDVGVFRNGTWYLMRSRDGFTGVSFGSAGDIPQAADFDGDGKADLGVFRPSNGAWYVLGSQSGFFGFQFGQNGDKPVAADFDGDKKADIAVYRGGAWYIMRSRDGFAAISFGIATDKPVAADYDGDGKADVAVYRGGNWYMLRSSDGGFRAVGFGIETDTPVPADYNGDGTTDIAVFRDGTWHVLDSGAAEAGYRAVQFGSSTDMPVPYR